MSPAPFNVSPVSALDDAPPFRRDVIAPLFARSPGRAAGGPLIAYAWEKLPTFSRVSREKAWKIRVLLPHSAAGARVGGSPAVRGGRVRSIDEREKRKDIPCGEAVFPRQKERQARLNEAVVARQIALAFAGHLHPQTEIHSELFEIHSNLIF